MKSFSTVAPRVHKFILSYMVLLALVEEAYLYITKASLELPTSTTMPQSPASWGRLNGLTRNKISEN